MNMYSDIGGLLQFALNQLITEGEHMVSVRSNHIEEHDEVEVGSMYFIGVDTEVRSRSATYLIFLHNKNSI